MIFLLNKDQFIILKTKNQVWIINFWIFEDFIFHFFDLMYWIFLNKSSNMEI